MTRTAFLAALEQLLAPLPEAERKDALSYYEDYLDAAGPENEARAIAELGRDDIHIVSFDGMIDVSELVRVGEIDAVFAQDPYEMGKQCIDYAVKKCNGEQVEDSVYTDVTLITSSNAEAHISELQRQLGRWGGK